MNKRLRPSMLASAATLLLAIQTAGTDPATQAASSQPAAPRLICEQPVFKLQRVWSGDKVEHKFTIRNTGSADLQIINVEAACGCFVAEDYPKTIAPGQKGDISVSLQTARGAKEVHKEMQVETNDSQHPKTLLTI